MNRRIVAGAAACLILAGCGSSAQEDEQNPTAPAPTTDVGAPGVLTIPAIDVESTLVPLGLTETGEHEVPPLDQQYQAGWFEPGPEPGEAGPSILLGHVNGGGRPGVFVDLGELTAGDEILVDDQRYEVYEVLTVDKDSFPRDAVYGNTDSPELRLVTCGGSFSESEDSYESNVIVSARLASS